MRLPAAHGVGESSPPTAGSWSSIERQLPLLIFVVLLPTVVILVLWTHGVVRSDLEASALARMRSSAREMQAILGQSLEARIRVVNGIGMRPALVELAEAPLGEREAAAAAARESLQNVLRRSTPQVCEVWSLAGELLLREVRPEPIEGEPQPPLHRYEGKPPETCGVQPLRMHDGQMFFDVVAKVRPGSDGKPTADAVGYVVLRRKIADRSGADLLGRLIVANGELRFGNADGSLWTDLERAVAAPAGDPLGPGCFRERDGVLRVGAGARVDHAPWVVWVEGDAAELLAPAGNLALRMSVIGAVLLVAGGAGALWISRRVTRPLREATRAATAIAAGRYERRLVVHRDDEVGRLTQAFNVMAEQVERSREELEERVAARTADLRRALEQLRDAQEDLVRQEKLALLGQLAGGVGHELRNPLAVMSNTVFWLEQVLGDTSPEVRERLGVLRRQISLSEKITTDLLDFTRKRQTQVVPVAMDHVVADQLTRLGPVPFAIERHFTTGVERARADAVHVGQIVFNLLTNAAQAIGQQSNGRIVLRLCQRGSRVRLEVEDNGPGVPEPLRAKIFEPLFTTRAHGIGLGLAVSRRLSQENGGELLLEVPDTGRGARFVFELPALPLVGA